MTLAHDLHVLVHRMDRVAESLLAPVGTTYKRYLTLLLVGLNPGGTQRTLAAKLDVSEAAVSRMVTTLVEAGLVRFESPAGTGRTKQLTLTDAGEQLVARGTEVLGNSFDDVVRARGLDPERLATTIRSISDALEE